MIGAPPIKKVEKMARNKTATPRKKLFTVEQANRMLPLVRSIVKDIVDLANDLRQRQERFARIRPTSKTAVHEAHQEEVQQMQGELAKDAARVEELVDELRELGVELKGWDGLVDFPCMMDGREVYLCWKMGEPEVSHWHEIEAGFLGRQKLYAHTAGGLESLDSNLTSM